MTDYVTTTEKNRMWAMWTTLYHGSPPCSYNRSEWDDSCPACSGWIEFEKNYSPLTEREIDLLREVNQELDELLERFFDRMQRHLTDQHDERDV